MLSANKDTFTSSFPTWIHFISFSYLIALSRTSSTRLHRSGVGGHPFLASVVTRKAFSLSPLSIAGCEFVRYDLYCVEVYSFCTQFVRRFTMKACCVFVKCFFCIC